MTSRVSAFVSRGALLVIALSTTCGAAAGATVHGEIDFFLPGQTFGGSSSNVYADSRELVTGCSTMAPFDWRRSRSISARAR